MKIPVPLAVYRQFCAPPPVTCAVSVTLSPAPADGGAQNWRQWDLRVLLLTSIFMFGENSRKEGAHDRIAPKIDFEACRLNRRLRHMPQSKAHDEDQEGETSAKRFSFIQD